jgi:hypothetical protein
MMHTLQVTVYQTDFHYSIIYLSDLLLAFQEPMILLSSIIYYIGFSPFLN